MDALIHTHTHTHYPSHTHNLSSLLAHCPHTSQVECADGTKYKEGEVTTNTQRGGPALTDAEIEAK